MWARGRWAEEEGDSSTGYFFRLKKKWATDVYIAALRPGDGSLVKDKDGLCNLLCSCYLDLFTVVPCDFSACAELLSHISSFLLFDHSEAFEGFLSQGECFAALQGMARGKTPGCDSVISWQGSCRECLGPFLCVVRGLSDLCSPEGRYGVEHFHFQDNIATKLFA